MFFSKILLTLPVLASAMAFSDNSTLSSRTWGGNGSPSSGGSNQQCARVAGSYGWFTYDFGCLCRDDLDEYCRDNGINSYIKSAMDAYISKNGKTSWYPHNAQPTCDNRGGYTCGSLYKKSDGSCSSSACSSNHWSTNGSCCPRGQTYSNGRCCGTTGCRSSGQSCTPIYTCPQGQEYKSTQCCKTYLSEINGKCACPSGYTDTGSKCQPKCKDNEKVDSRSGKCVTICDENNGFTYQRCKNSGPSICCPRGQTAYTSVCCSAGKEEVDKTGVCCTAGVGAKVTNGKCIEPTAKPKPGHYKRDLKTNGNGTPIQLTLKEEIPYGMEENNKNQLCPYKFAACPIEGGSGSNLGSGPSYECINPLEDLQSCGGCASMGAGQDCSAIPGAKWMGCNTGKCQVYSCKKGWKLNGDGTACLRK
ncbi:uncharacterized protein I303_106215 [Kwoniella dejecticola CBS 10117]|uniref:Protein CPL1-like domain-containing protein n=1 Tax=Kwoniella dejecticola CBS 10117 TaxID=1296121 RepID=A0A1A6A1L0_9TREE|nr:uncharacterized protein I303_06234 [Kwoniella dejecticola CBS 10117]OBR83947.1 hypothetical protein I303_06234 [Kwoniella dejecticola CBS 10117]